MKQEHTPTPKPWQICEYGTKPNGFPRHVSIRCGRTLIAHVFGKTDEQREENIFLIVRAVNAHDDLVAAAEDVLLDMAANTANGLSVRSAYDQWASLERLRAALAKARG